jgi:hypothetical protein
MATIERRTSHGQTVYYAKVWRKGCTQSATFPKLSDAKSWVQRTEVAIIEGRYFPQVAAKRHTLTELIDRYLVDVLPHKRASTIPNQVRQLCWWKAQLVQPGRNNTSLRHGAASAHRSIERVWPLWYCNTLQKPTRALVNPPPRCNWHASGASAPKY